MIIEGDRYNDGVVYLITDGDDEYKVHVDPHQNELIFSSKVSTVFGNYYDFSWAAPIPVGCVSISNENDIYRLVEFEYRRHKIRNL